MLFAIFIVGEVRYIVIPNEHHTFWALQFLREYPNAYLIGTLGVKTNEKLNKYIHAYFTNDGLIYNTTNNTLTTVPFEWPLEELDFYCFYNVRFIHEVVFYHRLSSTLIVTDLAFNYFESNEQSIRAEGYVFRFYLWLADGYRQACVTKPFKYFFRNNIDAVKDDFDKLMVRYNNFNRLIMAHGTIIQHGGYEALKLGTYQFVLDLYQKEKYQTNTWSITAKIGFVALAGTALLLVSRYFSS